MNVKIINQLVNRKLIVLSGIKDNASEQKRLLWQIKQAWLHYFSLLPDFLVQELSDLPRAYIVVSPNDTEYVPGQIKVNQKLLSAAAFIKAEELLDDPGKALVPFGNLIDHYLGSFCKDIGGYISDGFYSEPTWQDFVKSFSAAYELAYNSGTIEPPTRGEYFATCVAEYLTDKATLSAVDPPAFRLLHSTIFSQPYWLGHHSTKR